MSLSHGLVCGGKCSLPAQALEAARLQVERVRTIHELLDRVAAQPLDVVLLVPPLPTGDVPAVIASIIEREPGLPVVVLMRESEARGAVRAVQAGATDVLFDSAGPEEIAGGLRRAADRFMHRSLAVKLAPHVQNVPEVESILGESEAAGQIRSQVAKIASSPAMTILIQGESGTGKDLVARTIHVASSRASKPFVPINCTAIPETLLESELFGHEQGAFTDARHRKPGMLELADGGTAFLDEVGEPGLSLQSKLLRFLEERSFRRLGSTRDISVDVRIVAATNRDLAQAVRQGRFRRDLYYRLRVVPIMLPPLRDHAEDVPILARHFLAHHCRRFHKRFDGFHPDALRRLVQYTWPGNVRELKNTIERVVLLEEGPVVRPEMLWLGETATPRLRESDSRRTGGDELNLERLELRALMRALEITGGNRTEAARLLGVSRDTVRARIKQHGIRIRTTATAPEDAPGDRGRDRSARSVTRRAGSAAPVVDSSTNPAASPPRTAPKETPHPAARVDGRTTPR